MKKSKNLVLASMFLAIGVVLPFFTMQIKEIGDSLLPMHLPVMLCGIICGWQYGACIGFILPFLRSILFSMPPIYPNAVWMAFELLTYGLVIGLLYEALPKKLPFIYISLISSMLCGRIVWGIVKALLLAGGNSPFTFTAFLIGGFADAFIGIVLQIIIIPFIVTIVKKPNHLD